MKKSIVIMLHIGFWFCYLFIILIMLIVFYRSSPTESDHVARILNAFKSLFYFALVPSAISFYFFYLLLFPKYLQQKKFLQSFLAALVISIGSGIISYALLRFAINNGFLIDMDHKRESTAFHVIAFSAIIGLISGIVALVIKGFLTWIDEIKLKEELKQKNHEIELALVKAQLDPHFLFNTLNNIDVLILKDPQEASNYLNKLSDILRFMLYETKSDKILLSTEIEYIEKYIELQKIRTSNSNYVTFNITGVSVNKTIAPMVFIPFIENAFKHTVNKKLENAIHVQLIITKSSIRFICENKFDSIRKIINENNGLGNQLILKRLNLLYPKKHTLVIVNKNDHYRVDLTLKHG